jgi:glycosyltransferase involved in cell wall biosynthesis
MTSTKLACFPRYGVQGASSRLRTYQYKTSLQDAGFEVTVNPLLSSEYVKALNDGRSDWKEIINGYLSRIAARDNARVADILFVEKELFPWLPLMAETSFLPDKKLMVLDFDDAIFHNYDQRSFFAGISPLRNKIDRLMRQADVVTAGSPYLMERARNAGAKRVEFLPTVVDLKNYPVKAKSCSGELTIGWIGSPTTSKYLRLIEEPLRNVCAKFNAKVVLVGARSTDTYRFPVTMIPWTEATESALISEFDIGVMPLLDGPWERGKCGYKLIQYMACARPVVASPVGANLEIVQHGVHGFHASDMASWERCLGELLSSQSLRKGMGAAGRERVANEFSIARGADTLIRVFRGV